MAGAAGSLTYTLSSAPTSLHHTLLQRADGAYCLMLWNEVSSWDRTNGVDINNADLAVTLTVPAGFDRARVFVPGQSAGPLATYVNPTSVALGVPDQVMVVELSTIPEPVGVGVVVGVMVVLGRRAPRTRGG